MNKWIQSLFLCLWAICGFNACSIDEELSKCPPPVADTPLAVTASLYSDGRKIDWADSSRVGVIMLQGNTGSFVYTPPEKPYVLSKPSDNLFTPVKGTTDIGRPEEGTTQDAIGFHPLSANVNGQVEIPFSIADQSNQPALDLIVAKRVTGITHDTDTLHLDFYRQMCRLQFNLSLTEIDANGNALQADDKLAEATVEINGMPVSAQFSWKNFSFVTSEPAALPALVNADGKSGQAIVYPRAPGKGVTFKVTIPEHPDTVYTFGMDPELELASGKAYSFDMKLVYKEESGPIDPEPVVQHTINYRYEGEANSSNVTVYKEGTTTVWPLNEAIHVDEHGSFTFGYDSKLSVSIRTEDGKEISLSPNQPYSFTDITEDIIIVISARKEEPVMHRINYRFEGDANQSNVKVFKQDMLTPWHKDSSVTVVDHEDLLFGYTSSLEVTVRSTDGTIYSVEPGKLYTLADITADITLIFSASIPLPPPVVYHEITYEYNGTLNSTSVPVKGTTDIPQPDWLPNQPIQVEDGSSFTFRYEKEPGYLGDVTVTLNGEIIPDITSGQDYIYNNVKEDMHFILYDKGYHTVTVITNLPGQDIPPLNTSVISGNRYRIAMPAGTNLIVKVNGKTITPTADGLYLIEHVTKDTIILITNDKGSAEPDLIIKADVHDWEELPVIDGGVIVPDK